MAKSAEYDRLLKLLRLTTSHTDGEALAAIRKANEWLLSKGLDWDKLLSGTVTIMADPFTEVPAPTPDPIHSSRTPHVPPTPQRPQAPPAPPRPTAPPPSTCIDCGKTIQSWASRCATCSQMRYKAGSSPRRAAKAFTPAQAPRTFTPDLKSSTRRAAPDASDL